MRLTQKMKVAILQAEQYDTARYTDQIRVHPERFYRFQWTTRAKITWLLSYVLGIKIVNGLINGIVRMIEWGQYGWCRKRVSELKAQGLRVIVIVGSYGKTSVKNYAFDLLRQKYRTVMTPGNYNTLAGIRKSLRWEVDQNTEIFIAEVGAYRVGEIEWLCKMLDPDIGVLTGIAKQHLERFGSMEKIITAKTEIVRYMNQRRGTLIANQSDPRVVAAVSKAHWYSGEGRQKINLNGAKMIAEQIGMSDREIRVAERQVRQVPSRFEITTERYGMKVIDDSYNSNEWSFVDAVLYLGKQNDYTRILVTPGLLELGEEEEQVHIELGKAMLGSVDYLILVGDNSRTRAIEIGVGGKIKTLHINKTLDFIAEVKKQKWMKEPLVLIENDVPENYL